MISMVKPAFFASLLLTSFTSLSAKAELLSLPTPPPKAAVDTVVASDPHPFQNQSFLRLSNLSIQTLNSLAFNFTDKDTSSKTFPNTQILTDYKSTLGALQVMGSNYSFFAGNRMGTIGYDGSFYTSSKPVAFQPDVIGGVYFTKQGTQELVTVDSFGTYFETKDIAAPIRLAGGNHYIDRDNKLTTIKSMGSFFKGTDGVNYRNANNMIWHKPETYPGAVAAGGNYFVMNTGEIVVVTAKDGFAYGPFKNDSKPKILGGTYFMGEDNVLYTISSEGKIFKNAVVTGTPKTIGYSYYIAADDTFVTIDSNGTAHNGVVHIDATSKAKEVMMPGFTYETNAQFVPSKRP